MLLSVPTSLVKGMRQPASISTAFRCCFLSTPLAPHHRHRQFTTSSSHWGAQNLVSKQKHYPLRTWRDGFSCILQTPRWLFDISSSSVRSCHTSGAVSGGGAVEREGVSSRFVCEPVMERALLSVCGADSDTFLQGIISNDMNCLHNVDCQDSLYSLILNPQGRVLYDIIVYKVAAGSSSSTSPEPSYWLECEQDSLQPVLSMLRMYRLRSRVSLSAVDSHSVWALTPECVEAANSSQQHERLAQLPPETRAESSGDLQYILERDPRIPELGYRLLLPRGRKASDVLSPASIIHEESSVTGGNYSNYRQLLYRLGIGEGSTDLPTANCFPSESNADYLFGVSYTKGCYIGQELTARTHHTGVTRKRLMPLEFDAPVVFDCPHDEVVIKNDAGKPVGKFRNVVGKYGLALLRFHKCSNGELTVQFGKDAEILHARTHVPVWWDRPRPAKETSADASQH